jgi:GNAT superfamily N-acetyltransferase
VTPESLPRALEPVAARGWPAAEEQRIGEWRLFASSGYSGRINACWPMGRPDRSTRDAIADVEFWYRSRGLPTRFKIIEGSQAALASRLAERGYQPGRTTLVMTGAAAGEADPEVGVADFPGPDFIQVFLAAQAADPRDAQERLEALDRIPTPRLFGVAVANEPLAIGACAVEGDWAGVLAMRTDPGRRRKGFGRRVLATLLAGAARAGAISAYLQVEEENLPAISLYLGAGFEEAYRYNYWMRSQPS